MTDETTPDQRALEQQLAAERSKAATVSSQNERLVRTLKEAREQIVTLRAEIDRIAEPPSAYAILVEPHADRTVDILTNGRKMRVAVSPACATA